MGARIVGWGTALPDKTITNADLERTLDTSDAWIVERTGIRERRIGTSTTELAIEAGEIALEHWGGDRRTIDLVVLATSTPDQTMPASASAIQHGLGLTGGAFDLNAACSGFVYALIAGHTYVGGSHQRALVIGAETMSRIVDRDDRGTAILFGDGAGAVVVEAVDGPGHLLSWDVGSDGSLAHLLYAEHGGTIKMDGKEVFRKAVRVMVDSSLKALGEAGLTVDDIALVVPHQANVRIVDAACKRLGIDVGRVASVLERTGNTSSASIPLALVDAIEHGRVQAGDKILVVGFGAGMSWASAIIEWPAL